MSYIYLHIYCTSTCLVLTCKLDIELSHVPVIPLVHIYCMYTCFIYIVHITISYIQRYIHIVDMVDIYSTYNYIHIAHAHSSCRTYMLNTELSHVPMIPLVHIYCTYTRFINIVYITISYIQCDI